MKKFIPLLGIALLAFSCNPEESNNNDPEENYTDLSPREYYTTSPKLSIETTYDKSGYHAKDIMTYNSDDLRIKEEYYSNDVLTGYSEISYGNRSCEYKYYNAQQELHDISRIQYLDDARTQECMLDYLNPAGDYISRKETIWENGRPVKWNEYKPKSGNPKELYIFCIWIFTYTDTDYTTTRHHTWKSYYEDGTPTGTGTTEAGNDDIWTYQDKEKTLILKEEFRDCYTNKITSRKEYTYNKDNLLTGFAEYGIEEFEGPMLKSLDATYTYSGNTIRTKYNLYKGGVLDDTAETLETLKGNIQYNF